MFEVKGRFNTAIIYSDKMEQTAIDQIIKLCNQEFVKDCKIRIMPDYHAGIGCVIGLTADLGEMVIPNLVGVDIGCGMYVVELGKVDIDLPRFDEVIHKYIPAGTKTHQGRMVKFPELQDLYCYRELRDTKRIERSLGTLGGGNHFIELNKDDENNIYLVIHSGSRNLGKQVADLYQNLAVDLCSGKESYFMEREAIIKDYKEKGKRHLIQAALNKLKNKYSHLKPKYDKELCYLGGEFREKYLHDMKICQDYAALNRETISNIILQKMSLVSFGSFHTVHNYINFNDNIIRKGSVSAYAGEKLIIPINMRDGSIIAIGKGNPEWNYSAPHGAGRTMSRSKAKEMISISEYQETMQGIYTTSVNEHTLDESPQAYKPVEEILSNIQETVDVAAIVKPIYNYKANN